MSSDDNSSEPRPTWREKLSHSLFGSYPASTSYAKPQPQPQPPLTKASTSEESLTLSDDSCRSSNSVAAAASSYASKSMSSRLIPAQLPAVSPKSMEDSAKPIPIVTGSKSSSPPLYESGLASDSATTPPLMVDSIVGQERVKEGDKPLSSSLSSSRKRQLSTIFSAWMPASSSNGNDRIAGRSGSRLNRADGSGSTSGVESEPARSPSIGHSISHGVKALQQRHRLNREAIETFKTMKIEDSGSKLSEGSTSSESINEMGNGRVASSPEKGNTGQDIADFNATNSIPEEMLRGEMMLKVTPKKVKQRMFRLDSDRGQIFWESKRNNKVNLESIRELRTGAAAASYRASMSISASHESRWISIIYQTEGVYKAVHLIALSDEAFRRWTETLSAVQNERKMLMSGIDFLDQRQQLWLRQHWKAADSSQDSRLNFVEVTKLCRRLGILSNGKDLLNRFQQADTKGKGFLDYEDFQHFVTLLKRRVDMEILFLQWADLDVKKDALHQFDFTSEEELELTRENLHRAVKQAGMSRNQLECFLVKEQGYSAMTKAEAVDLVMNRYGQGDALDHIGFASFLTSSDNAILSDLSACSMKDVAASMKERGKAQTTDELIAVSSVEKTTQDMTRPLSEYFISSSHNTYLVGGQWKGDSTVEGYVRALLQGARSVEIDCWNGPGNEPQVTHGRTLTSKVPFRDVAIAIERYAFAASPFPLILSLEVHNDIVQQDALATILQDILGDKLLKVPLIRSKDALQSLPSPQELRGKVLVKAKNLLVPELLSLVGDEGKDNIPLIVAERRPSTWTTDTTGSESDHLLQSARGLVRSVTKRKAERQSDTESKGQPNKVLMSPLLASLLIYTIGVKHRGINKKEHYAVEHMISLSERSGVKYLKSDVNCEDLIKHNRSHLTRVYPSMSSFKRLSQSANFLPILFWCMGCQLVAINWQTLDVGFEMNQAMFSRNAKCGYVLKPEILRLKENSSKSSPRQKMTVQISIRVISAQQLPRFRDASRDRELDNDDVIDPFVSLCIVVPQHRDYSVKSVKSSSTIISKKKKRSGIQSLLSGEIVDKESSSTLLKAAANTNGLASPASSTDRNWLCRQKTSVVKANGFNPIWNETLTFSITFNSAPRSSTSSATTSTTTNTEEIQSIQAHTRGFLDLCFLRFEVGEKVKVSTSRSGGTSSDISSAAGGHESDEEEIDEEISASDDETDGVNMESLGEGTHCLATHMISLGSLAKGYRHVPLYDAQLSQYLFSTLFIKTDMHSIETS